jgi:hypothetical protein
MSILKFNNVYPIIHIAGAVGKGTEREPLSISGSPSQYEAFVTGAAESQTSGALVEGDTYLILSLEAGDDFANVGYVEAGTPFVATGTTPTDYTNSTVVFNLTESDASIEVNEVKNVTGATATWAFKNEGGLVIGVTFSTGFMTDYNVVQGELIVESATVAHIDETSVDKVFVSVAAYPNP